MKIPLHIAKALGVEDRIWINVNLSIKANRYRGVFGNISALIDTGSFKTVIAPEDAKKLRVPFNILPPSSPKELRIGGVVLPAYVMEDVLIGLKDEHQNLIKINLPKIDVLNRPQQYKPEVKYIPSILGTDFLKTQGFIFYFDALNMIAYLERL